jgi:hypothetical protein
VTGRNSSGLARNQAQLAVAPDVRILPVYEAPNDETGP